MTTNCVFPTEIIRKILCHARVQDVLRWRVVSEWFCAITHDPVVWDALYEHATFPRPPGPFHSVAFKNAFLQSARLAQSWAKPVRKISRFEVPYSGYSRARLIGGRWFICKINCQFMLYDTDAREEPRVPQVLFELKEGIDAWNEYSAVSEDGNYAVYLMLVSTVDGDLQWTLVELRLDAGSGALIGTHTLDVPITYYSDEPLLHSGLVSSSRYFVIPGQWLVFDMRTRTFYTFPRLRLASHLKYFVHRVADEADIVLTTTHVIVFRNSIRSAPWEKACVIVQAFTFPNDQHHDAADGNNTLRLSHEGSYDSNDMLLGVIRNSNVDPSTGDISVKLLARTPDTSHYGSPCAPFDIKCIDLTLYASSQDEVSDITVEQHTPLMVGNIPPCIEGRSLQYDFVSDRGYARGLYVQQNYRSPEHGIIMGFTVDATQPRCSAILGEHAVANWIALACRGDDEERRALADARLDGVRGRLVYEVRRRGNNFREENRVVVVDIE